MFGEVERKRGRPRKIGGRRRQIKVMLTEREYQELRRASANSGISQSDIVRSGTKIKIDFIKNGIRND